MSRLDKLPTDWKLVNLGKLGSFINGDRGKNYPSQEDFYDSGIPFINAGHIQDGNINLDLMNYISEERFNLLGSGKIKPNDIVYCLRGSLGKTAIVKGINQGAIASSLVIIRPFDCVLTDYLYYFLTSSLGQSEILKYDNGSSQPNLSAKSVKEYTVPVPPLEEQRRIAAILGKADAVRRKRQQAIALTEELLRSAFLEMFGDPVTNPKGWEIVELGNLIIGKPNNGIFRRNDEYGGNIPVIWVKELFSGHTIDHTASRTLAPTYKEIKNFGLRRGDILFCRSSLKLEGIGYNNVFDGDDYSALFECHTIRVSPDQFRVNSIFLNYLLRRPGPRKRLI